MILHHRHGTGTTILAFILFGLIEEEEEVTLDTES